MHRKFKFTGSSFVAVLLTTIALVSLSRSIHAVDTKPVAAGDDERVAPSQSSKNTSEQATSAATDADRQIAAALNHPTTIHLQKVSLEDALLVLSETCGLPIAFYGESFEASGAEISPTVVVQANGEPLGSVLRSLAQSAIGGAKIGISVVAKDGALRISADARGRPPSVWRFEGRRSTRHATRRGENGPRSARCRLLDRDSDALGNLGVECRRARPLCRSYAGQRSRAAFNGRSQLRRFRDGGRRSFLG